LSRVTLELREAAAPLACTVEGYVTRCTPAGFAVEWLEFNPPLVEALLGMPLARDEGIDPPRVRTAERAAVSQ
jgi:hypothetical protein